MSHRHTIGKTLLEFFVGMVNSDQTEGRGFMKEKAAFPDHLDAFRSIRGEGVMGVGDGDVVKRTISQCGDCPQIFTSDKTVYKGYKVGMGKGTYIDFMSDGWRKDYSPMANDPEYATYLKLKERFEQ